MILRGHRKQRENRSADNNTAAPSEPHLGTQRAARNEGMPESDHLVGIVLIHRQRIHAISGDLQRVEERWAVAGKRIVNERVTVQTAAFADDGRGRGGERFVLCCGVEGRHQVQKGWLHWRVRALQRVAAKEGNRTIRRTHRRHRQH